MSSDIKNNPKNEAFTQNEVTDCGEKCGEFEFEFPDYLPISDYYCAKFKGVEYNLEKDQMIIKFGMKLYDLSTKKYAYYPLMMKINPRTNGGIDMIVKLLNALTEANKFYKHNHEISCKLGLINSGLEKEHLIKLKLCQIKSDVGAFEITNIIGALYAKEEEDDE